MIFKSLHFKISSHLVLSESIHTLTMERDCEIYQVKLICPIQQAGHHKQNTTLLE